MEAQFRLGLHVRVLEDESRNDGEREGQQKKMATAHTK